MIEWYVSPSDCKKVDYDLYPSTHCTRQEWIRTYLFLQFHLQCLYAYSTRLGITSLCCVGRSSHTVNQQQGRRSSREACGPLFPCSFEEAFVCLLSPPVMDVGPTISLPSTILR